jgi:hypothetical protein
MGVDGNGWLGGDGSMADAIWDSMASGQPVSSGEVTAGPLTYVNEHVNTDGLFKKTARVLGNDNSFESSQEPGGNRTLQTNSGAGRDTEVQQSPQDAKGSQSDGDTKKDSGPTKGSRGAEAMKKIKAKRAAKGDVVGEETATTSVKGGLGISKGPGHNLQVKDGAPTPKELDPSRRVGNLADNHQKSSWTGSGPQAALHDDYSKVGEVDPELLTSVLDIAGVPFALINDDSFVVIKAASAATMVKEAAADDYLSRMDAHPLKIVAELTDMMGEDWTEWEPETIRETLEKEAGIDPSDDVMNKIMAVKIVLARPDRFYDDWHAFEKIAVALNDCSPSMGGVEEVPVEWLSNAVSIIEKLAAEGDFSAEVKKYTAARLFDQGYVIAPPKLAFANEDLGPLINDDGMQKKVILAYKQALASGDDPETMRETPVNIQVARLMRNHTYVMEKMEEGRRQLA